MNFNDDFFGKVKSKTNVDKESIIDLAKRLIEENRVYKSYCYFINCFEGEEHLGLGSQVSQISASLYLSPVDHYIKDNLGIKYYIFISFNLFI